MQMKKVHCVCFVCVKKCFHIKVAGIIYVDICKCIVKVTTDAFLNHTWGKDPPLSMIETWERAKKEI